MNPNKICFITCVNDEVMYQESLLYIENLKLPESFAIENVAIREAECITQAYNSAMCSSDAKYKVYLHQDVFIINKNFVLDIIDIFERNSNIGMIGVAGSAQIPTNGIWWESKQNYGKVYDSHSGKMELVSFLEVSGEYQNVQVIDGLILITQYDIPWREDIFTGWHFYDLSQSIEFLRSGYEVAVPKQAEPWCIHDSGVANVSNGFNCYRKQFLEEYSKDLLPLVSILIPAYNQPAYLEKALVSALAQDYYNCEIVICDDSTLKDVEILVKRYQSKYKHIKYYNNGGPLGGKGAVNIQKCFDICQGEYIGYLLHDDLYMPNKVSTMMNYLLANRNIKLVTSYRKLIDANDHVLPDFHVTRPLFDKNTKIKGRDIGRYMLTNIANVIGEMSTTLYRKADIVSNLLNFQGYQTRCLGDVALWLSLLEKGDLLYVREPLSCFRIHQEQNTNNHELQILGAIDWYKLIILAYQQQVYLDQENINQALKEWINRHKHLISNKQVPLYKKKELYSELESCYNEAINWLNKAEPLDKEELKRGTCSG
ncbi:hypothetical protein SDC9_70217 [bioreactor metagenome]|uniref:Uncharacterized protein n=1 Tax=bioreactor metagenome TaxID=1076179 RepID=A0A644YB16_9ZZZZ